MTDFTFYFGASSGGAQKALRRLQEPNVMISYATLKNTPWEGIESLFMDSGGYSLMLEQGEHPPPEEYLTHIARSGADLWAPQDYPCEPEILEEYGRSVEDHQRMTVEKTEECLNKAEKMKIQAEPVTVIQGWEPREYRNHAERLRERGLLTETVAIGSICRRNAGREIAEIIKTVHDALPDGTSIHAFGVKQSVLSRRGVLEWLDSADSGAWNYSRGHWRECAIGYLRMKSQVESIVQQQGSQLRLPEVMG